MFRLIEVSREETERTALTVLGAMGVPEWQVRAWLAEIPGPFYRAEWIQ